MSGSKNCPETIRQKMIGMMYLVLTAMLALNVSTQVLHGFTLVDNSLHETIESSEERINNLYVEFNDKFEDNKDKVGEWHDQALVVQNESNALFEYIEEFKKAMLQQSKIHDSLKVSGRLPDEGIDNLDISADYAINRKNGKILKDKIDDFRSFIGIVFNGNDNKKVIYNTLFSTKSGKQKDGTPLTWENKLFSDVPVSAVITMLTKYQNDIRTAEADMIQFLMERIDVSDTRVNRVEAFVIPTSKNVFVGGRYNAEIVLAAVDTTRRPNVFVNGSQIQVRGTKANYETTAGKTGRQEFSGYITLPEDPDTRYPFKDEYFVSEPTFTVSNVDLNVVFLGLDNKFSVSVPGISPENVRIAVSGGGSTFTSQGSGKYTIKPSQMGDVKIDIFAKSEGKESQMGSSIFKVKRLPRPSAFIQDRAGNEKEGRMAMADLRGASVIAGYGPDAVVAATFTVISFTMIIEGLAGKNVVGNKLDESYLNSLKRGKNLIISNIKVKGPDGKEQPLGAIVITAM